jgi:PEP-CTERM motif
MLRRSVLIALLLGGLGCFQSANATVFLIDRNIDNGIGVAGSITTDGTLGTLATSNIDAWDLTVTELAGASTPATLTNGNSTLGVVGTALSETATQLTFDFSAAGTFELQNSTAVWCLFGTIFGGCGAGGIGISTTDAEVAILATPPDFPLSVTNPKGAQVIGTSVPEPGSFMLLGGALAVFGLLGRSKRRVISLLWQG